MSKAHFQKVSFFLSQAALFTVLAIFTLIAINPDMKAAIQSKLSPEGKTLLSTVQGKIVSNANPVRITKIREDGKLFIEVYRINEQSNSIKFHSKIPLEVEKDSYLTIEGVSTNLALADLDGDQVNEILVPGLLKGLSPTLLVYKYESQTNAFYLVNNQDLRVTQFQNQNKTYN